MTLDTASEGLTEPTPSEVHRAALRCYDPSALRAILQGLGEPDEALRSPGELAGAVADHLATERGLSRALAGLPDGPRQALGLFALTEVPSWPAAGLARTLRLLGNDPQEALGMLLTLGLVALRCEDGRPTTMADLADPLAAGVGAALIAHPEALASARAVAPDAEALSAFRIDQVRQTRESDGLEPILRLAALWQRVEEAPLRVTQQGTLYKRDRDRLGEDPALTGPITEALVPLPDLVPLWLELARRVGLLCVELGTDRLVAAAPDYWAENSVHLPQMVALAWLNLDRWIDPGGEPDAATATAVAPFVRPAVLLWLAAMEPGSWLAVADLADHLSRLAGEWSAPLAGPIASPAAGAESTIPTPQAPARRPERGGRGRARRGPEPSPSDRLTEMLLGPAYLLGLVRVAEEDSGGRRVVALTDLGRYVLALGPPPPPRGGFPHFLFVQPNFEIIAYRQGLTPPLIGQFSRFARWEQLGAAVELSLTPQSLYRGLEGGLTPAAVLDRLARHSSRPLPAGVAETLRSWASRRERVTYYTSATLIEFAAAEELEAALVAWPPGDDAPVRIAERLLLVEGETAIPFHRFRMLGARDYRRPPEVCVEVEPDGVTLALDPNRSDLIVDAELARLADEQPRAPARDGVGLPRRRFAVTPRSLARAVGEGLSPPLLARWFRRRTGADLPPAIRLLLPAIEATPLPPAVARRPIVLTVAEPAMLDGLLQHPTTCAYLGERLGPRAAIVPEAALDGLRRAMASLGLGLELADPSP